MGFHPTPRKGFTLDPRKLRFLLVNLYINQGGIRMPKRWIPFGIACIITAFIMGLNWGASSEFEHITVMAEQRRLNTTIAVVNTDTGVLINGNRYNYSAAIIETLSDDFTLVSPAMAQTGFANGTYGAVVIFPPDVSSRILTFNATQPERVQLEFQINSQLPERDYLDTHIAISALQLSINTTLANTYVSSIFRQFHEAQDQVYGIFQNNLAGLMALDIITLGEFTSQLDLDDLPQLHLDLHQLDTEFYLGSVIHFASNIAGWYLDSYERASEQFLWMREGWFELIEDFPEQQDEWLERLMEWTNYSVEFGELLEIYSAYVRAHEDALSEWHLESVDWHEELERFHEYVTNWHETSTNWFEEAERWHEEYMSYLEAVREFAEAVKDYHAELVDNITPLMNDIEDWKELLKLYEQELYDIFYELSRIVYEYNTQFDLSNLFREHLLGWSDELYDHQNDIEDWFCETSGYLYEWHFYLDGVHKRLDPLLSSLDEILADSGFLPPPNQFQNLYTGLQASLNNLGPPNLTPDLWNIPQPPDIQGFPNLSFTQHPNYWNTWIVSGDPFAAIMYANSAWQTALYNHYFSEFVRSYSGLMGWFDDLEDFHDDVSYWFDEMSTWHGQLQGFAVRLDFDELPGLPVPFVWEPMDRDALVEPDFDYHNYIFRIYHEEWDYEISAPPPYEGAEIAAAFDVEFPLSGDAITEASDIDGPLEFVGPDIPDVLEGHDRLTADQPLSPLIGPPPRPDGFWSSLNFMYSQISSFYVEDFLSYDIHARVDDAIQAYGTFLESLRAELNHMFGDNVALMHDVHAEYNFHLEGWRWAALAAQAYEQRRLQYAIGEFGEIKGGHNDNTVRRLNEFAVMMPESRISAGVNQSLVDFTVAPFELTRLDARYENPFVHSVEQTRADTYRRFQMIALIILALIFLATLASTIISHQNKKKKVRRLLS